MQGVVGVWKDSSSKFDEATIHIYTSGVWQRVTPYVYTNGAWTMVGGAGTLMVPFYTSSGSYEFHTSASEVFQVREHDYIT